MVSSKPFKQLLLCFLISVIYSLLNLIYQSWCWNVCPNVEKGKFPAFLLQSYEQGQTTPECWERAKLIVGSTPRWLTARGNWGREIAHFTSFSKAGPWKKDGGDCLWIYLWKTHIKKESGWWKRKKRKEGRKEERKEGGKKGREEDRKEGRNPTLTHWHGALCLCWEHRLAL